jgi:hypothetical protein
MTLLAHLAACQSQEVKRTDAAPTRLPDTQPEQPVDTTEEQLLALIARSECRPVAETSPNERKAFVDQYQQGIGNTCLAEVGFTDEGDPVYDYLLIKNNTARLIIDGREDKFWGDSAKVRELSIADLNYGYWDLEKGQFVVGDLTDPSGDKFISGIIGFRLENGQIYRSFNWLGP